MVRNAAALAAAMWVAAWGLAGAPEEQKAKADPTADYVVRLPRDVDLPNKWRVDLSGNVRLREEWWHDFDLDRHADDNDGRFFMRTRLRADMAFDESVRAVAELFDCREWESDRHPRPQIDELDVHQAYLQFDGLLGLPLMLRVGRQELSRGSRLLLAAPDWNNYLRAFDAARLTYASDLIDVHLFYGSVVVDRAGHFDEHTHGERFFGIFTVIEPVRGQKVDLFALGLANRRDHFRAEDAARVGHASEIGEMGTNRLCTVGGRLYGSFTRRWTFDVETACQHGRYSSDRVRAWAFYADTAYTLPLPWEPTLKVLFNCATGDHDPNDGVRNTFDPLYSSTHDVYGGIMDLVTWMNLKAVGARLKVKPVKKLALQAEAHRYWLAEGEDAWYLCSKAAKRRDPTGQSGNAMGHELGVAASYAVNEQVEIQGGAACFFPGEFVRNTGPGDRMTFVYLQTTFRF